MAPQQIAWGKKKPAVLEESAGVRWREPDKT